jgi:hypothetical protein
MAYMTVESLCEEAFRLYLDRLISEGELPGHHFIKRFASESQQLPFTQIVAMTVTPFTPYTSTIDLNCRVQMVFRTYSHANEDSQTEHDNAVAAIADWLYLDNVPVSLNAVMAGQTFKAHIWTPQERSNEVDEHYYITEQRGELVMMPQLEET